MARHVPLVHLDLSSPDGILHEHVHQQARLTKSGPDAAARAFIAEHEQTVRPLERDGRTRLVERQCLGPRRGFQGQGRRPEPARRRTRRPRPLRPAQGASRRPDSPSPDWRGRSTCSTCIYLEKQVDPELLKQITAKANVIEKTFNGYRANVERPKITDSEVRRVLKESRDSAERKAVWEGSKGVGPLVEADLKALVKLRNEAAQKLGFADYHKLQLHLERAVARTGPQALRRARRADARAVPQAQGRDRRQARRAERRRGRRPAALALSRPVLPGVAGHLRRRLRLGLRQGRHPQALPRLLRRASACRSTT